MAYLTLEVERQDFDPNKFDLFQRGHHSLRLFHLKKEIYKLALKSNKVFIYYNGSELILKDK
jgi:hypothetical protein